MRSYEYTPGYAIPPGETLVETMEYLRQTSVGLAQRIGMAVRDIKAIDEISAPLLQRETGIPDRLWINLERNYQERLGILADRDVDLCQPLADIVEACDRDSNEDTNQGVDR